jgi:hypothetical protein
MRTFQINLLKIIHESSSTSIRCLQHHNCVQLVENQWQLQVVRSAVGLKKAPSPRQEVKQILCDEFQLLYYQVLSVDITHSFLLLHRKERAALVKRSTNLMLPCKSTLELWILFIFIN